MNETSTAHKHWTRFRRVLERVRQAAGPQETSKQLVASAMEVTGANAGAFVVSVFDAPRFSVSLGQTNPALLEVVKAEAKGLRRTRALSLHGITWILSPVRSRQQQSRIVGTLVFGGTDLTEAAQLELFDSFAAVLELVIEGQQAVEYLKEQARFSASQSSESVQPTLDDVLFSPSTHAVREDIDAAILSDAPLLILGESGTGKTALARAIATASGRQPIVRAVLGASDDLNTITSELFGHERGAYSGAIGARKGVVEFADGGTLILDEILNLPPHAQQLLLDFTQFGTYRPLGYQGSSPKRASVRIIAATNGNMEQAIRDTRFRQDLFFRLSAFCIRLPPLREFRSHIPSIATSFLHRLDPTRRWSLNTSVQSWLRRRDWSGNIRELEGSVRRARDRALAAGHVGELQLTHFGATANTPTSHFPDEVQDELLSSWEVLQNQKANLEENERALLREALSRSGGNISKAARSLGIPRTSLISRKKTLSI